MIWICVTYPAFIIVNSFRKTFERMMCQNLSYPILFVFVCVMVNAFVIKFIVIQKLRWSETVYSTFQDLQFDGGVIITTLYRLMPQSWYQQTTQSSVNKLLLILWHNRLP